MSLRRDARLRRLPAEIFKRVCPYIWGKMITLYTFHPQSLNLAPRTYHGPFFGTELWLLHGFSCRNSHLIVDYHISTGNIYCDISPVREQRQAAGADLKISEHFTPFDRCFDGDRLLKIVKLYINQTGTRWFIRTSIWGLPRVRRLASFQKYPNKYTVYSSSSSIRELHDFPNYLLPLLRYYLYAPGDAEILEDRTSYWPRQQIVHATDPLYRGHLAYSWSH